jgi:hypothetical protein
METLDNNITSQDHMRISASDRTNLLEVARWARFLAIVGFVMLGIMALAVLSMVGLGASNPLMRNSDSSVGLSVVLILLFMGLYSFPIYYLFKAAKGIKSGLSSSDDNELSDGFSYLKSHYKFLGIFMIVILAIYALALLAGLGAIMSAI